MIYLRNYLFHFRGKKNRELDDLKEIVTRKTQKLKLNWKLIKIDRG